MTDVPDVPEDELDDDHPLEAGAQKGRQGAVQLHGGHGGAGVEQAAGQQPQAGTDLQDMAPRSWVGLGEDPLVRPARNGRSTR